LKLILNKGVIIVKLIIFVLFISCVSVVYAESNIYEIHDWLEIQDPDKKRAQSLVSYMLYEEKTRTIDLRHAELQPLLEEFHTMLKALTHSISHLHEKDVVFSINENETPTASIGTWLYQENVAWIKISTGFLDVVTYDDELAGFFSHELSHLDNHLQGKALTARNFHAAEIEVDIRGVIRLLDSPYRADGLIQFFKFSPMKESGISLSHPIDSARINAMYAALMQLLKSGERRINIHFEEIPWKKKLITIYKNKAVQEHIKESHPWRTFLLDKKYLEEALRKIRFLGETFQNASNASEAINTYKQAYKTKAEIEIKLQEEVMPWESINVSTEEMYHLTIPTLAVNLSTAYQEIKKLHASLVKQLQDPYIRRNATRIKSDQVEQQLISFQENYLNSFQRFTSAASTQETYYEIFSLVTQAQGFSVRTELPWASAIPLGVDVWLPDIRCPLDFFEQAQRNKMNSLIRTIVLKLLKGGLQVVDEPAVILWLNEEELRMHRPWENYTTIHFNLSSFADKTLVLDKVITIWRQENPKSLSHYLAKEHILFGRPIHFPFQRTDLHYTERRQALKEKRLKSYLGWKKYMKDFFADIASRFSSSPQTGVNQVTHPKNSTQIQEHESLWNAIQQFDPELVRKITPEDLRGLVLFYSDNDWDIHAYPTSLSREEAQNHRRTLDVWKRILTYDSVLISKNQKDKKYEKLLRAKNLMLLLDLLKEEHPLSDFAFAHFLRPANGIGLSSSFSRSQKTKLIKFLPKLRDKIMHRKNFTKIEQQIILFNLTDALVNYFPDIYNNITSVMHPPDKWSILFASKLSDLWTKEDIASAISVFGALAPQVSYYDYLHDFGAFEFLWEQSSVHIQDYRQRLQFILDMFEIHRDLLSELKIYPTGVYDAYPPENFRSYAINIKCLLCANGKILDRALLENRPDILSEDEGVLIARIYLLDHEIISSRMYESAWGEGLLNDMLESLIKANHKYDKLIFEVLQVKNSFLYLKESPKTQLRFLQWKLVFLDLWNIPLSLTDAAIYAHDRIRPKVNEFNVFMKEQEISGMLKDQMVRNWSEDALTNEAETKLLFESHTITMNNWATQPYLNAFDAPEIFLQQNTYSETERFDLLKFFLTDEMSLILANKINTSNPLLMEKLREFRKNMHLANPDIQILIFQKMLAPASKHTKHLLANHSIRKQLMQIVMGKWYTKKIARIFVDELLNAFNEGFKDIIIAQALSVHFNTAHDKGGSLNLGDILMRTGPLGVRQLQYLLTSGAISEEMEEQFRNAFDNANSLNRHERILYLKELLGDSWGKVLRVGSLINSASINEVSGIDLQPSFMGTQNDDLVIRYQKPHAQNRVGNFETIWRKLIKGLKHHYRDKDVQDLAILLEQSLNYAINQFDPNSENYELDMNLEREHARKLDPIYQGQGDLSGFQIRAVQHRQDLVNALLLEEDHKKRTTFMRRESIQSLDTIEDSALLYELSQDVFSFELSLYARGLGDGDPHPGNWGVDLRNKTLVRLDIAQPLMLETAELNAFRNLMTYLLQVRLSDENIDALQSSLKTLFPQASKISQSMLEKYHRMLPRPVLKTINRLFAFETFMTKHGMLNQRIKQAIIAYSKLGIYWVKEDETTQQKVFDKIRSSFSLNNEWDMHAIQRDFVLNAPLSDSVIKVVHHCRSLLHRGTK